MAKIKGRIGNRGKIRPLVRKRPEGRGPHWSITKRAAVWERRRVIDEVFEFETITVTDAIEPHLNRFVNDSVTFSDTANINGEKVVINSQTITVWLWLCEGIWLPLSVCAAAAQLPPPCE